MRRSDRLEIPRQKRAEVRRRISRTRWRSGIVGLVAGLALGGGVAGAALNSTESETVHAVAADLRLQADRLDALTTTSVTVAPTTTEVTTTTAAATTTTQPPGGGVQPPPGGGTCGTSDQPSIYPGVTLTMAQAIQAAYAGGFHTVSQIRTIVGIGWAESNRITKTRNWHNAYKNVVQWRPATDVIGVQGPASVWCNGRQFHSDRGWLQISSKWWAQFADAQADDPVQAAVAAFYIFTHGDGTGFGQWNTNGSAKAISGQPAVSTVCATVPATGC